MTPAPGGSDRAGGAETSDTGPACVWHGHADPRIRALGAAVSAIYFADSADYIRALWDVVRALDSECADLLESRTGDAALWRVDVLATRPAPDAAAGVTDEWDTVAADIRKWRSNTEAYTRSALGTAAVTLLLDAAAMIDALTDLSGERPALAADRHRAAPAREGRAGSRWPALWKQRAKRHRELHKGYEDAANHFAGEAREMAALATRNADFAEKAIAERDALAAELARVREALRLIVQTADGHANEAAYYGGQLDDAIAIADMARAALAARTPAPGGA